MKRIIKISFVFLISSLFLFACDKCPHDNTIVKAENFTDATETSEGSYEDVIYCKDCDKELKRTAKTIAKIACVHIDANEDFACDKCEEFFVGENHKTHVFDREVAEDRYLASEASCTEVSYYYKSCGCGAESYETFTKGWFKHNFSKVAKEEFLAHTATCASPAEYYMSCECGEVSTKTFNFGNRLSHVFEDDKCTLCNEPFRYVREGDYIYFGEYPQTIKASNVKITDTPTTNGEYIGTDGERYVKMSAQRAGETFVFSNGEALILGKEYYFKIEPIKWRIVKEKDREVILVSDKIIDFQKYDENYSHYEKSDIRTWLNGEFLETAFSEVDREIILKTAVDNGEESTGTLSSPYICNDTEDEIFLLSYEEIAGGEYGFGSDAKRQKKNTDYTKAIGLGSATKKGYVGNSAYMLRTPFTGSSIVAIDSKGGLIKYTYDGVQGGFLTEARNKCGVLPAIRIELR